MSAGREASPEIRARSISRWPVVVLVTGLALAVALVLIGAALAGAPAAQPTIGQPGTVEAPRDVNVIMRDYRFDPTPLYLVAGETVRLHVINGGLVEHELVLGDAAVQDAWLRADAAAIPPAAFASPPPASLGADPGGVRIVLPSGGSTTVEYHVPIGDDLMLVCHLPGHAERGMIGQVVLNSR